MICLSLSGFRRTSRIQVIVIVIDLQLEKRTWCVIFKTTKRKIRTIKHQISATLSTLKVQDKEGRKYRT